jgi:hypothetical protein
MTRCFRDVLQAEITSTAITLHERSVGESDNRILPVRAFYAIYGVFKLTRNARVNIVEPCFIKIMRSY